MAGNLLRKTKEIEEQAVHEAMRGMEIRTHQEGQHNNASELQGMPSISTMSESTTGEMPPIPEGPYNDADYAMPPVDENGYVLEMEELPQAEDIIFGKASRAKEKKLKIKEIDANSGRITLEGRIVNSECRETKTGKGMLIFEIYDGTGVITCKSFAEDATKGNEILEKMKSAKLVLPPKNETNNKVICYLMKRGIDLEIIENCIKKGMIYEDYPYNNAIFLGFDLENRPRYCGEKPKLSTLSTWFSTFNFRFSQRMWKEPQLSPIQHSIHSSSTSPWKTKSPHPGKGLQSFPHLPHPLLRLLQQVQ